MPEVLGERVGLEEDGEIMIELGGSVVRVCFPTLIPDIDCFGAHGVGFFITLLQYGLFTSSVGDGDVANQGWLRWIVKIALDRLICSFIMSLSFWTIISCPWD